MYVFSALEPDHASETAVFSRRPHKTLRGDLPKRKIFYMQCRQLNVCCHLSVAFAADLNKTLAQPKPGRKTSVHDL